MSTCCPSGSNTLAQHLCCQPPRSCPARGGRFALWPDIWGVAAAVTLGLGRTGPAGLLVGLGKRPSYPTPPSPGAHFQEHGLWLAWWSGGGGVPRKSSQQPRLCFPPIPTSASFNDSGASTLRPSPTTIRVRPLQPARSPSFPASAHRIARLGRSRSLWAGTDYFRQT